MDNVFRGLFESESQGRITSIDYAVDSWHIISINDKGEKTIIDCRRCMRVNPSIEKLSLTWLSKGNIFEGEKDWDEQKLGAVLEMQSCD